LLFRIDQRRITPQIAIQEVGDDAQFLCLVDEDDEMEIDDTMDEGSVIWSFTGPTTIKNYKIFRSSKISTMEIEDIQQNNEGYYECSGYAEDVPFMAQGKIIVRGESNKKLVL